MKLKYVVITSVDRDDLPDRGAGHFAECVKEVRCIKSLASKLRFWFLISEDVLLKPLEKLKDNPPDVFNHNLEKCATFV